MKPNRYIIGGGVLYDGTTFPATGDFAVGSRTDIAVLDYIPITPIDDSNILAHMMP